MKRSKKKWFSRVVALWTDGVTGQCIKMSLADMRTLQPARKPDRKR